MSKKTLEYITVDGSQKELQLGLETTQLTLENMEIQSINLAPLVNCESLVGLYIRGNNLRSIELTPLSSCKELSWIDLSGNNLEEIGLSPLASCTKLNSLNLSANNLESIDLTPLSDCNNLEFLFLSGNKLISIDLEPLFSSKKLKRLSLDIDSLTKPIIVDSKITSKGLRKYLQEMVNVYPEKIDGHFAPPQAEKPETKPPKPSPRKKPKPQHERHLTPSPQVEKPTPATPKSAPTAHQESKEQSPQTSLQGRFANVEWTKRKIGIVSFCTILLGATLIAGPVGFLVVVIGAGIIFHCYFFSRLVPDVYHPPSYYESRWSRWENVVAGGIGALGVAFLLFSVASPVLILLALLSFLLAGWLWRRGNQMRWSLRYRY